MLEVSLLAKTLLPMHIDAAALSGDRMKVFISLDTTGGLSVIKKSQHYNVKYDKHDVKYRKTWRYT